MHLPPTDRMDQFIKEITQEFTLNDEAVAFATKMFVKSIEDGLKMYEKDEQQAFAFAVRVVRLLYEDDESEDEEEVKDEQ